MGHVVAALVALLVASAATLTIPLAVRRVIDHGFSAADAAFVNQYFGMMMAVVLVLAAASAARFYFVTWLGERVVSDMRTAVFSHILALSPAFFDRTQSGEVISRLAADTTQIKSAVAASVSVFWRGYDDGGHQPAALRPGAGRHSSHRPAAGRLRARRAAALAHRPGHARRCHRLRQRGDYRGSRRTGLQQ
jgi:ABC-type multidrug transport system fused ATPase/permease subunit